jgi:hypothetical protein
MNESAFQNDLSAPGHMDCQGCGASPAMRHVLEALFPKTVVVMPDGLLALPRFHSVSPCYTSPFCLLQRRRDSQALVRKEGTYGQ